MDLESLRDEIRKVDMQILDLISQRVNLAEKVGECKIEVGLPVRNPAMEEKVIKRYRDTAEIRGLNPDTMEFIAKSLIKESVDREASIPDTKKKRLTVSIVGGFGKMGKWLGVMLSKLGHTVLTIDPASGNNLVIADAAGSDVIIVSAPIHSINGILMQLDAVCREDALIFDIASLKSPFIQTLKDMAQRRKVCSVHPMFGPSAGSLYGRNIVLCNCGNLKAIQETAALFGDKGGNIRVTTIEDHDKYMAYVLGLSHAVNIAFFTVLERSGIPYEDMKSVASTTFSKIMDTNHSVAMEDPGLYYEIQHMNVHRDEMWSLFTDAVEDVMAASMSDNSELFLTLMEAGREYFSE